MSSVPFLPDSAPFTAEQRAWLNGFFAGLFSRAPGAAPQPAPAPAAPALIPLTILWGSQTGTSESLAKRAAKEAGKTGFAPTILDLAHVTPAKLAQEKNVLLITSTYGDGEPPDNARALHAALAEAGAAPLPHLRFSICSLGDTNYEKFCQCGKEFDARLEKLGALRLAPRVDCDVDYEARFAGWLGGVLEAFKNGNAPAPLGAVAPTPALPEPTKAPAAAAGHSRQRPFPAPLLTTRNLNAAGSAKRTHHVEFSLEGSGLSYEAGDALGVFATNCPELVDEILQRLGCDGEEAVPAPSGEEITLRKALLAHYDLGKPSAELIERVSSGTASAGGVALAAPLHVIDLLQAAPRGALPPTDLVARLKKLQPRLYSISSSPRAHAGQVHLTVGVVSYESAGRSRKGVCSTFLSDRSAPGSTVPVFVHANSAFRLPADGARGVIMIGPGTGIAPFRGFLHERRAAGASGKNWLFFGDQRAATDFLYREELEGLLAQGALTRLDTAFSRDQAEKIYVQQRILENARPLYGWLQEGAHLYVCGDASRMAKDVDAALHRAVEQAGGKTPAQAAEYVAGLKAEKRYCRDVY